MKPATAGIITAICLIAGLGSARAEYRCDPPNSRIDRRACEAAAESPQALNQYVQRMRWMHNLYFYDYVNRATIAAWDAKEGGARSGHSVATTLKPGQETAPSAAAPELARPR